MTDKAKCATCDNDAKHIDHSSGDNDFFCCGGKDCCVFSIDDKECIRGWKKKLLGVSKGRSHCNEGM